MRFAPPWLSSVLAGALVATLSSACLVATLRSEPASYTPSPFAGRTLYVDPSSAAARDATSLAATDATTSRLLHKIADHSQADWYGGWIATDQVQSVVARRVAVVTAARAYPVLVAYDIPKRDCNSYSGGGAPSPDAYRAWIRAFKAGIGSHPAAVILEPDALAQLGCLSANDQQTRIALLHDATQTLASGGNVAVYIDAGHAGWIAPSVMASRLSKAGVALARGFSLNVSNFDRTADEISYGRAISPSIGWKRFVVDTSRNGLGPATGISDAWCNPPGRALGQAPTATTGDPDVDAFLWIKHPGESDGTCRGGPAAGTWWRDYAVGLALRAAW